MPIVTTRQQIHDLMKVALGEAAADLALINGDIVNVYTGEVLTGNTVLIKGDRIAYVGKSADMSIGPSTEVIDASGKTLIPGLIDGHAHLDYIFSVSELSRYAMRSGTTTIISEVDHIVFPLGYQGIIQFLKSAQDQPIKIFATIPPMGTMSRTTEKHALTVNELRKLFRRREVIRLGESYWAQVITGYPRVVDLIAEAIDAGKRVDGHSAGARGNKLQAYVASGISSCHEPITVDEVKERLRLGLFTMVRESAIRSELEVVAEIKDENIDLSRLGLVTDTPGLQQLIDHGYMEFIVQKAINVGFDPITAIKMATINIAQHFGIDNLVGGIAPGKCADIVVIPNLRAIRPEYVISNGRLVARDGRLLVEPKKYAYPKSAMRSIRLTRDLTADDFAIPVDTSERQVKVRVMDSVTELVTREAIIDVPVANGRLDVDVDADLLKVAAIDKTYMPGKTFVGFIRGFKLKRGAMATSGAWDACTITVVGVSEADMAQAVNRVRQLKGGVVVCADGKMLAEISLPVGGIISLEPIETLASMMGNVQQAAASLGFPHPDMPMTLAVLSSPAIPFLRICEEGLFNVSQNRLVDLIVG